MNFLVYLLVGAGSGLVSALCGVGGGIVLVPIFVMLLKLSQQVAVATSLAVIIPTALAATINNYRANLIQWDLVVAVAVGASAAAWFGTNYMHSLPERTLQRIFGCLLLLAGGQMLLKSWGG